MTQIIEVSKNQCIHIMSNGNIWIGDPSSPQFLILEQVGNTWELVSKDLRARTQYPQTLSEYVLYNAHHGGPKSHMNGDYGNTRFFVFKDGTVVVFIKITEDLWNFYLLRDGILQNMNATMSYSQIKTYLSDFKSGRQAVYSNYAA